MAYEQFMQPPAYQMYGQPRRPPRYTMFGQTPTMPATPGAYAMPNMGGNQVVGPPPSYNQPGINDPTLAVGGGGGGMGQVGGRQTPPGAIQVPIQGGNLPPFMYDKGWRKRRGPDGHEYWFPPGSEQPDAPSYALY